MLMWTNLTNRSILHKQKNLIKCHQVLSRNLTNQNKKYIP